MPSLALRDRASHLPHLVRHALQPSSILHPFGEKLCRCYLPEESVLVGDPSAFQFLPAASGESLPVIINFFLRVAADHERHGFGELELRAPVQGGELLANLIQTKPSSPGLS